MSDHKMVPVEPTPEMLEAGKYALDAGCHASGIYADMLASTPAVHGGPSLVAWVLYDATADQKYIKASDDGALAIFDSEAAARRARTMHPGTDYKRCEYYSAPQPAEQQPAAKFKHGDLVRKIKGSQWKGRVVGTYSTELTPEGYAVESDTEKGSVQIYPAAALEMVTDDEQPGRGVADYEKVLDDQTRLTRELHVLLNGEEGAAQQASLADLVAQLRTVVRNTEKPVLAAPDVTALVAALEEIENPIKAMRDRLQDGEHLDGFAAVQLAGDAEYLRRIAREALAAHRKQEPNHD